MNFYSAILSVDLYELKTSILEGSGRGRDSCDEIFLFDPF